MKSSQLGSEARWGARLAQASYANLSLPSHGNVVSARAASPDRRLRPPRSGLLRAGTGPTPWDTAARARASPTSFRCRHRCESSTTALPARLPTRRRRTSASSGGRTARRAAIRGVRCAGLCGRRGRTSSRSGAKAIRGWRRAKARFRRPRQVRRNAPRPAPQVAAAAPARVPHRDGGPLPRRAQPGRRARPVLDRRLRRRRAEPPGRGADARPRRAPRRRRRASHGWPEGVPRPAWVAAPRWRPSPRTPTAGNAS